MSDKGALLVAVLTHYGADMVPEGRNRSIRCLFHDDKHASASVNTDEGVFFCFTCSVKGDAYSIVMSQEGVSFVEAERLVAEFAGESHEALRDERRVGSWLPTGAGPRGGNGKSRKARPRRRKHPWL